MAGEMNALDKKVAALVGAESGDESESRCSGETDGAGDCYL